MFDLDLVVEIGTAELPSSSPRSLQAFDPDWCPAVLDLLLSELPISTLRQDEVHLFLPTSLHISRTNWPCR